MLLFNERKKKMFQCLCTGNRVTVLMMLGERVVMLCDVWGCPKWLLSIEGFH